MARTSVTNIENGKQSISIDTLYIIADALDVNIGDLLPVKINEKITLIKEGFEVSS